MGLGGSETYKLGNCKLSGLDPVGCPGIAPSLNIAVRFARGDHQAMVKKGSGEFPKQASKVNTNLLASCHIL